MLGIQDLNLLYVNKTQKSHPAASVQFHFLLKFPHTTKELKGFSSAVLQVQTTWILPLKEKGGIQCWSKHWHTGTVDRPGALHLEKRISPSEFPGKEKKPILWQTYLIGIGGYTASMTNDTVLNLHFQESLHGTAALSREFHAQVTLSVVSLPQLKGSEHITLIYVIMLHHVFLENSNMQLNFSYCWQHCKRKQITWAKRSWQYKL